MAQDRLAALRAQRQQRATEERHEMTGAQQQQQQPAGNGFQNDDGMSDFYAEVTSIQDAIQQFNSNVSRISDLHSRSLHATDEAVVHQNNTQLETLVAETRSLSSDLRERIKALAAAPSAPRDVEQRKNRTQFLQKKFIESLQNYQQVEAQYRDRYKQQVERQFRIVKPDATPEEISAVVNDDNGGGGQVFAQALSSSTQYGASRAAYREVQERHQDIRRIEQTFVELTQLIADMSVLVEQQDDTINAIETSAQRVEDDTEAGLKHTATAVKSARSARKLRWTCFIIFLIIAIILIVVLVIEFGPHGKSK